MAVAASGLLAACGVLPAVQDVTDGSALGTGGSSRSMIFIAPTDVGPIVIDLGWSDGEAELVAGLRARGWRPSDVAGVLLTHAHRDHIGAWRVVAGAPFHLARAEVPLLTGEARPEGPLDGWAARVWPARRPAPGDLRLRPFDSDTVIVFGSDTVRAFLVPGHTRGSAAYLFRGVLFVGDGAGSKRLTGLGPPAGAYSYDAAAGGRNLARVLERAGALGARYVCTAHARCVTYDRAVAGFSRASGPPGAPAPADTAQPPATIQ